MRTLVTQVHGSLARLTSVSELNTADESEDARAERHASWAELLHLRRAGPEGHQASGQQGRIVKGIVVITFRG